MTLSRALAGAVLTIFIGAGCTSTTTATPAAASGDGGTATGPEQDKGIDPGSGTASPIPGQGTEKNPYGVAYPTANLGYTARAGTRAGNIIRNYKFLGYRDGDPSKGTEVISLADYFDPDMKAISLIHFSAGALWCPPCNEEAKALVPIIPTLKAKKVVVIQAIIEGNERGTGSTPADLDEWQKRHSVNYTIFLDPEQGNLGQFFDAAAIPWNALIDARSMELLTSGTGYNPKMDEEYTTWLAWIAKNPAQAVQ